VGRGEEAEAREERPVPDQVTLDLLCLALLVVGALAGAASGALRQLAKLAAAGIALAGVRLAGPAVADARARTVPRFVAGPLSAALTFAVLYVLLGIALGLAARAARATGVFPASVDRGVGALLGGAKTALIAWVAVSALVAWGRPLPWTGDGLDARSSGFAAFARDHSALGVLRRDPPAPRNARERREAAAAEWRGTTQAP
jgi:membrane protein required for colicin V production